MIETAQAFGVDIGGSGIKAAPVNLEKGEFAEPRLKILTPEVSTPEAVAVNLREARIPDNAGNQPPAEPVAAGGPAAYFATVPVRKMVTVMTDAGIPASLSLSAGSFVCNDVFYALSHRFHGTPVKMGFIHVPWLPEQAGGKGPGMSLEDMVRGLEICIAALDDSGL